jgi:hypothetical protein
MTATIYTLLLLLAVVIVVAIVAIVARWLKTAPSIFLVIAGTGLARWRPASRRWNSIHNSSASAFSRRWNRPRIVPLFDAQKLFAVSLKSP